MTAYDRVEGPDVRYTRILRGAFLLIVVTFSLLCAQSRAADAPRRVLILHSFNYTFPATTIVSDAIRKRLLERSPQRLEIEVEYLDLARRPDDAHALRMANFLREKYAGVHFDLVVVVGVSGIPFIQKFRDVVGPGVPVVFSDVTRSTYEALHLPPDVTGVINNSYPAKTLELAERLQPGARRLVVIGGSDSVDRRWREIARKAIEAHNPKLETAYWSDLTYDALLTDVSRLPSDSIVLLLTFFADSEGKRFIPRDVAAAVAKASTAPVYGLFDTYIGTGIVGGYTDTFESLGITAADMALEILSGTDVTTLPPRANPKPAFRVDARAMERWGLKERNLPPGSVVLFKEPSLWDQHRNLIAGDHVDRRIAVAGRRGAAVSTAAAPAGRNLAQGKRGAHDLYGRFRQCRAVAVRSDQQRIMGAPSIAGRCSASRSDVPLTRDTFLAAIHPEDRDMAVGAIRRGEERRPSYRNPRSCRASG